MGVIEDKDSEDDKSLFFFCELSIVSGQGFLINY